MLYIKENSSTLHGSAEGKKKSTVHSYWKSTQVVYFSSCFLPPDVSIVSDLDALVKLFFFFSPLCGCVFPV